MRAIVQRVHQASVEVNEQIIGQIGRGLCCFVGTGREDQTQDLAYVADKIVGLRIFPDESGKMSQSLLDVGGEALLISQFTVYGDTRRGRRPSFASAMAPDEARESYQQFVQMVKERGVGVATGQFAATMRVRVDNDGPVSILIDSRKAF